MMNDTDQLFWVVVIFVGAMVLWRIAHLLMQVLSAMGALIDDERTDDERLERLFDELERNSNLRH
jgi:hypothetical protein